MSPLVIFVGSSLCASHVTPVSLYVEIPLSVLSVISKLLEQRLYAELSRSLSSFGRSPAAVISLSSSLPNIDRILTGSAASLISPLSNPRGYLPKTLFHGFIVYRTRPKFCRRVHMALHIPASFYPSSLAVHFLLCILPSKNCLCSQMT